MIEAPDELVEAIMAASRALVAIAAVSIESAPVEVTLNQFRALLVLSTGGPLLMSRLAQAVKQSPSSATRLVERLERKALVVRRPSPTSRRSTELHLTAAGATLVDTVMATRRRELVTVIEAIPEPRRLAVLAAFEDFATAAGEPFGPSTYKAKASAAG